jgi:large conductance mechanosensitive channel
MIKILKEFKEFAVKGDAVDMSVGIIIGAAFTSIVNSLVKDIFTPLLGLLTADVNFTNWFLTIQEGEKGGPYASLELAQADNAVVLNIGLFINSVVTFMIVAFVLFFLIRAVNQLKRPEEVTADPVKTKECPHCFSNISAKARRCPFCTSEIEIVDEGETLDR